MAKLTDNNNSIQFNSTTKILQNNTTFLQIEKSTETLLWNRCNVSQNRPTLSSMMQQSSSVLEL